jgi:hypothetical protein
MATDAQALAGSQPDFRALVAGGFFSANPFDHSVPRSIRTNNPGALNITPWQRTRPGFAGETEQDGSANHNVTTIYEAPEYGVGSWFFLLSDRYDFKKLGEFSLVQLAQRYAGQDSGNAVRDYIDGWTALSHGALTASTVISLDSDLQLLTLAKAMFAFEAGRTSPLLDDQILFGIQNERNGTVSTLVS